MKKGNKSKIDSTSSKQISKKDITSLYVLTVKRDNIIMIVIQAKIADGYKTIHHTLPD